MNRIKTKTRINELIYKIIEVNADGLKFGRLNQGRIICDTGRYHAVSIQSFIKLSNKRHK
jgi:hypothetical protein